VIARTLTPPKGSFFLLGPRGTGKSTWANTAIIDEVQKLSPPLDEVHRLIENRWFNGMIAPLGLCDP
jgi:hypothetical protein